MAFIELEKVNKEYLLGNTVVCALQNVSMAIDKGSFLAVWGPSGSGKTTLLNLIGVIDEPSSGKLLINGVETTALTDNQKTEFRANEIGFVFQRFNLIPVLSALENVMLPLQIKGSNVSAARHMAIDRLAEVGLGAFMDHRPDKLSGGQQQRVAIARALVCQPSIIIADEPTANLDSKTASEIISLMRDLNRSEKTTFLFSTHDQRLLEQVDELICLEDGKIIHKEVTT